MLLLETFNVNTFFFSLRNNFRSQTVRGNFKNFGAVFGIFPLVRRVEEYWIPLAIRRGIVRMVFHGSAGFRDTTGRHHHHGFGRLSVLDSSIPKISDIGPAVLRLNTTLDAVRIGERYWIR